MFLVLEYSSYLFKLAGIGFLVFDSTVDFVDSEIDVDFVVDSNSAVGPGSAVDFVMNGVYSSCRYPKALFCSFRLY